MDPTNTSVVSQEENLNLHDGLRDLEMRCREAEENACRRTSQVCHKLPGLFESLLIFIMLCSTWVRMRLCSVWSRRCEKCRSSPFTCPSKTNELFIEHLIIAFLCMHPLHSLCRPVKLLQQLLSDLENHEDAQALGLQQVWEGYRRWAWLCQGWGAAKAFDGYGGRGFSCSISCHWVPEIDRWECPPWKSTPADGNQSEGM